MCLIELLRINEGQQHEQKLTLVESPYCGTFFLCCMVQDRDMPTIDIVLFLRGRFVKG